MANSRLNLILREKYGLVYSVDASYGLYTDAGTATIYFGCEKANVQKCLTLIERELRSLREETLSPRALNSAKKQLLGQMAIAADNGEAQVLSMGKSLMTYGRVISNSETAELISGITAEEIRDTAADITALYLTRSYESLQTERSPVLYRKRDPSENQIIPDALRRSTG